MARQDRIPGFFEVLGAQRAHRSFTDEPVEDALIEQLLWAATRAPSAENLQPWYFVVVRDQRRRAAIGELATRAWEEGGRAHAELRLPPELLGDVERGAMGGTAAAPVLIVVCADTRIVHPNTVGSSIFPSVQNLLVAATALGLGSALTTLPLLHGREVSELLALPESVEAQAVVPIGWPALRLGPARRRPVGEVSYRETFGHHW